MTRRMDAAGSRVGGVVNESELKRSDGGTLHVYDTGADSGDLTVVWHHGSPNIGMPPKPLFPTSDGLGIRWVSYDRPGYGGSSAAPGRDIASAADFTAQVADSLGLERFAVMGHSGGGPHALACGALLDERVLSVVSISGLAPYAAEGLDYFAGMAQAGVASLRAATEGQQARAAYEESADDEDIGFTEGDEAALGGEWSWFIDVVRPALQNGPAPMIDDDLAAVGPWGFDPSEVDAPALVIHGTRDRVVPSAHGQWLARRCRSAELWLRPDDGHISVMDAGPDALRWVRTSAADAT